MIAMTMMLGHGTIPQLSSCTSLTCGPCRDSSAGGQASRAASAPVEGEEERPEGRAREGPSERRYAEPGVLPTTLVAPRTRARSPRTSSASGAATSTPVVGAPLSGVRT
jgi:hypothetical protein